MSWSNEEYSAANGQPVALYEFIRGGIQYFRYTNADRDITHNGVLWRADAISDSGLSQNTGENIEITVPPENAVINLYRGVPPTQPVAARISRFHYTDDARELKTVWVGTIKEVRRQDSGAVKIISASVASSFSRNGLRLTWGRGCPHALYDHLCKVNPAAFGVGVTISALDGAEITVNLPAGLPEGYFSGGYIQYMTDGITEYRGARVHTENTIGLFGGTAGLSVGMDITIYPGCDQTTDTCKNKFDNEYNHGGVPHLPGKSPFQIIKLF